ncbi:MAG: ABC transporter substrate-binding protein [Proteobacteria bacterium]|nr:ABC transporter substrate-binding protein [Pseudomonadota bacterium]MBI3498119.1 ABC transporter substrate-binding protein [Pseudomonadota bacterium]
MAWKPCLIALSALSLISLPALAQTPAGATSKTLKLVPHADLRNIDPVWTTAIITRNHAYMVYDALFGVDEGFAPRPQMVGEETVSADGLTYTLTLRSGLKFHDGVSVTAADAAASVSRWMKRDAEGQALASVLAEIKAIDVRTLTVKLKQPYGFVESSLGRIGAPAFIMPERVARTDAFQQIDDTTGSGPYRFERPEWRPGNLAVYTRFKDYAPRAEPTVLTAGAKLVKLERVEWVYLPDPATAVAALNSGEVDMIEAPTPDLLPLFQGNANVKIAVADPLGMQVVLRPNHLQPPFDNPKARQALYYLVQQSEYMRVMAGSPEYWRSCDSLFMCGTPTATSAGAEIFDKPDLAKAKQLFEEAGYKGEPVVVLYPTDHPSGPAALVTAENLRKIGVNVRLEAMDWATLTTRRASKNPVSSGGWSIFHTRTDGVSAASPLANNPVGAGCEKAWFGWPCDSEAERLRLAWPFEADEKKRRDIVERLQLRLIEIGSYVVVGQYTMPTAYRSNVVGLIASPALVLWNIEKR